MLPVISKMGAKLKYEKFVAMATQNVLPQNCCYTLKCYVVVCVCNPSERLESVVCKTRHCSSFVKEYYRHHHLGKFYIILIVVIETRSYTQMGLR